MTRRKKSTFSILNQHSCINRVSAASEIPGALELGRELRGRGIIAAIAHSSASYQDTIKAVEAGYSHVIHIYSGMSGVERVNAYRVAGVLESSLLIDELTTEMIGDGHHLPPSLMALVLKTKGLERVCLVSDSMPAAGLGPGEYSLEGMDLIVEADAPASFEVLIQKDSYVAKLPDRGSFASSVSTMDKMVKNMVTLLGISPIDVIKLATINPARMQRLDHQVGIIAPGMKADLIVFDEEIRITTTMFDGNIVYRV